jgi:HTH-type transcriptional regulator, competence development regulator
MHMVKRRQSVGEFLRTAREVKGMTLRAVERETQISNAYLSQLESDKIRQPSPLKLHKLCELYGVSYAVLMGLAGYPVPDHSLIDLKQVGLAARLGNLTREEENELVEYLAFLRSRKRR